MEEIVEKLGAVPVLSSDGSSVALGTVWDGRTVLLAMIRHFG